MKMRIWKIRARSAWSQWKILINCTCPLALATNFVKAQSKQNLIMTSLRRYKIGRIKRRRE